MMKTILLILTFIFTQNASALGDPSVINTRDFKDTTNTLNTFKPDNELPRPEPQDIQEEEYERQQGFEDLEWENSRSAPKDDYRYDVPKDY